LPEEKRWKSRAKKGQCLPGINNGEKKSLGAKKKKLCIRKSIKNRRGECPQKKFKENLDRDEKHHPESFPLNPWFAPNKWRGGKDARRGTGAGENIDKTFVKSRDFGRTSRFGG